MVTKIVRLKKKKNYLQHEVISFKKQKLKLVSKKVMKTKKKNGVLLNKSKNYPLVILMNIVSGQKLRQVRKRKDVSFADVKHTSVN